MGAGLMPRDKAKRPAAAPRHMPQLAGDNPARAIDALSASVRRLEDTRVARQSLTADLTAGSQTLNHGLGRPVRHVHVTPTVAAADFAYALASSTATQLTLTVVGTTQPDAAIEVS
jgi:hypothetical protein